MGQLPDCPYSFILGDDNHLKRSQYLAIQTETAKHTLTKLSTKTKVDFLGKLSTKLKVNFYF